MNEKSCTYIVFMIILWASRAVSAVPTAENAESRVATDDSVRTLVRTPQETTVTSAISILSKVYRVPISFEYSLVNEDGSDFPLPRTNYRPVSGETLSSALNRLCEVPGGTFGWKRVGGMLCVQPIENIQPVESTLDTKVSFSVENASTWEALMALATAMNQDVTDERVVRIRSYSSDEFLTLPVEFLDEKKFHFSFQDVSARDALCAILAASDFEVSFRYTNNFRPEVYPTLRPTSLVLINVYKNAEPFHRTSDRFREEEALMTSDVELTLPPNRRR